MLRCAVRHTRFRMGLFEIISDRDQAVPRLPVRTRSYNGSRNSLCAMCEACTGTNLQNSQDTEQGVVS